ncbi:MAG: MMPL family transporter [Actinomycetota bacterium]
MERIARTVLRHRWLVFIFWLVVLVAGAAGAGKVSERLSFDFSLPGQPGYETEKKIIESYGTYPQPSYIPTFTAASGESITDRSDDIAAVSAALQEIPGVRVIDYPGTQDEGFLTDDGRSAFSLVYAPLAEGFNDPLAETVNTALQETAKERGLSVGVTGYNQLAAGSEENEGPSVLIETLIGATGALVVLLFVFASFLAFVPLLIAAVAILSTFLIVLGLTTFTDVSFVVQFLISLVGLGVAIDYSLLLINRWREERAHGTENHEAVVTAMRTAGHAVVASGLTVAISLIALIVVPVPLIRSMGFGGMLIPVMSVLVVTTLLPALLGSIGPRVDWPRIRHEDTASRGWSGWARLVVRWRWAAAALALTGLAVMIAPVFNIQIGQANSTSLASNGEAAETLATLGDGGVQSGILSPLSVLAQGEEAANRIAEAAREVPGVRMAVISEPGRGDVVNVEVIPNAETVDSNGVEIVDDVRSAISDEPGYIGIAGLGATVQDYGKAVYDRFPLVLSLIAIITFILLVRTFRSVLLPLKAVILNLISVAAVFGISTWFWQEGNGSDAIFGISATGAMSFWIPVLVFAFLFGLSMDYEVFILARMREEYDATGSTSKAVITGLGRTGRLVTSAALILFFSFAALASAPGTDIKVFATALGVGILLDATIVRALLVPALVSLFGRWNWWLPTWLAKILRVEPSPLVWPGPPAIDKQTTAEKTPART